MCSSDLHAEEACNLLFLRGFSTLCLWNVDAKVKLLLAKALEHTRVRLIDVSPGGYAFEEMNAVANFQQWIAFGETQYYARLDALVLKFKGNGPASADGKTHYTQRQEDGPVQTREKAEQLKKRIEGANLPPYKAELVAKVKDLADHQSTKDPAFYCAPKGFPRVGPPTEIVASPKTIAFLYDTVNSSEQNAFRVIPVDGRPHDVTLNPSFYGDSIGKWEGNTLVVDVTNFVDETWLSQNGTIHSDKMHVVEKLTREGNVITWEVSIEDPVVFKIGRAHV